MRLFDFGASALVVIGIIYFGDWLIEKIYPPEVPCWNQVVREDGSILAQNRQCTEEDLKLLQANEATEA